MVLVFFYNAQKKTRKIFLRISSKNNQVEMVRRLLKKIVYVYECPVKEEPECDCDDEDCKICDPDYEAADQSDDDVSMTDCTGSDYEATDSEVTDFSDTVSTASHFSRSTLQSRTTTGESLPSESQASCYSTDT